MVDGVWMQCLVTRPTTLYSTSYAPLPVPDRVFTGRVVRPLRFCVVFAVSIVDIAVADDQVVAELL